MTPAKPHSFPVSAAIIGALAIFAAGYGVAFLTLPARTAAPLPEQAAPAHAGSAPAPATGPSLADRTGRAEKSSADLLAEIRDALADPVAANRSGRMWELSRQLTHDNAADVITSLSKGSIEEKQAVFSLLETWGRLDPKSAIVFARKQRGSDRTSSTNAVLNGWADVDPAAATAWVERRPAGGEKRWAMDLVLDARAAKDPDGLLKSIVADRANWHDDGNTLSTIFRVLANQDPAHAEEVALSLPVPLRSTAVMNTAENMKDPEAALSWLASLPPWADSIATEPPNVRDQARSNILSEWANRDSSAAAAWVGKLPPGPARDQMISQISRSALRNDPTSAVALVDLLTSLKNQDSLLRDIGSSWAREDPAAAQRWAESQTDPAVRKAALNGLVSGLAESNPAAAAPIVAGLPAGSARNNAITRIAEAWGKADPAAAAAWAGKLPDDSAREEALTGIAEAWAQSDPATAARWVTDNLTAQAQTQVYDNVARAWAQTDAPAAARWAAGLPEGQRANIVAQLASYWAANDPAAAAQWAAQLPGELRANASSGVTNAWAQSDPAAAAQWASQLPDGQPRVAAIRAVMESWISHDPTKAAAWFEGLPSFENRDATLSHFLGDLASESPADALRLTQSISNPEQKNSYVLQITNFWMKKDPTAARAWIGSSNLPDDVKQKLLASPVP